MGGSEFINQSNTNKSNFEGIKTLKKYLSNNGIKIR